MSLYSDPAKALKAIDPSDNYTGTEIEGLDPFARQLRRFDIKVPYPNRPSKPLSIANQLEDKKC